MNHDDFLINCLSLNPTSNGKNYAFEVSTKPEFSSYNTIEIELILYPYSPNMDAKDGINVQPYDNYLTDISENQKTLYSSILTYGSNIFGLLLGVFISLFYWFFNPSELFGLQSIVAIFGVYLVGKEIWGDLEQFLIDTTENWPVRYYPSEFSYRLRSETTLDLYTRFGRAKKYKRNLILADKLEVIRRSNSRDLKMLFTNKNFEAGEVTRLAIIHFDEQTLADFMSGNFLVAAKISLNRNFLFFHWNREFFQSVAGNKKGCLDTDEQWHEAAMFSRMTIFIGRVKFYLSARIIPKLAFLDIQKTLKNKL